MALLSSIIRRRRGQLLGGETGRTLVQGAEAAMRAEGILDPESISAIYVPIYI
jgi:hypothetical protein